MPVTNVGQIKRFAELSGAVFPTSLAERFDAIVEDPTSVAELGVSLATAMCQTLLSEGAPGLHFYTLNRSQATKSIYTALGLSQAE